MATDWTAILPSLLADEAAGMSARQIATKHQLLPGSVYRALKRAKPVDTETSVETGNAETGKQGVSESPVAKDEDGEAETASASFQHNQGKPLQSVKKSADNAPVQPQSQLDIDRDEARKALRAIVSGKLEGSAQQMAAIRLLLKDELDPETEVNPYAGIPTDELALRIMTLAGSVLGLSRLSRVMRQESQGGMMDLGLDYVPPDEIASEVVVPTRVEVTRVETLKVEAESSEADKAGPVQAFGVESLE